MVDELVGAGSTFNSRYEELIYWPAHTVSSLQSAEAEERQSVVECVIRPLWGHIHPLVFPSGLAHFFVLAISNFHRRFYTSDLSSTI